MKKILVTMLALSLALVSTVDAKITGAMRGGPVSEPVTKRIDDATADLNNAPVDEKDAAFADLIEVLKEDENLQEMTALEAKRTALAAKKAAAEKEAKAKKSGFGWFFQSGDYKAALETVRSLNNQLAEVNAQIKRVNKNRGINQTTYIAVSAAMGAIVTALGIVALERYFAGAEGYTGRAMTYSRTQLGKVSTGAKEQYRKRAPVMLGGTPATK